MGVAKGILKNAHIYQPSPALGRIKWLASSYRKSLNKFSERSEEDESEMIITFLQPQAGTRA